uniref:Arrestin C-terminal-like domain-containing protein n=1 Tax=Stomoxys calcitrans TaxID=35570 RepID=A0A1I8PPV0_STOCA
MTSIRKLRAFAADKTDEKFHRRASVKMGVRVIYRTDVFNHGINGPENFAALFNNPVSSPPVTLACTQTTATAAMSSSTTTSSATAPTSNAASDSSTLVAQDTSNASAATIAPSSSSGVTETKTSCGGKSRKSERGDSFPKLRLSPKSFRFSSRFGRSKSEVEKCPSDPFYNYSKSFQEYDSAAGVTACGSGGGPQGAVDKPFLLQDGRVGLRASLDKAWYTHGEDVCVTINIRNDSRKTVRKVRVCAIQHVDVCMFNNGKFKNVVADSDSLSPPPIDRTVPPGATLNTTVTLKPQRGPTKNWIALEDTLQRSTEPDEITGAIAASAVRTPHFLMQATHSPNYCSSPAVFIPPVQTAPSTSSNPSTNDERNVFAIYVSYYVKVKLTLSGMGGELSLKLPFVLVHIDEEQRHLSEMQVEKLALDDVPASKKNGNKVKASPAKVENSQEFAVSHSLDRIESVDDERVHIKVSHVNSTGSNASALISSTDDDDQQPSTSRRRPLIRSETIAKDLEEETVGRPEETPSKLEHMIHVAQVHSNNMPRFEEHQVDKDHLEMEHKNVSAQVSHELSINQIQEEHAVDITKKGDGLNSGAAAATAPTNGV